MNETEHTALSKTAPSMDEWLCEAKRDPSAPRIGMYLTHIGVVRETARAAVRGTEGETAAVTGMEFS